jgi:hypothetical protein
MNFNAVFVLTVLFKTILFIYIYKMWALKLNFLYCCFMLINAVAGSQYFESQTAIPSCQTPLLIFISI